MASAPSISTKPAGFFGVRTVLANLTRYKNQTGAGVAKGLVKAGERLKREAQSYVPVEFGELKASAYVEKNGRGFNARVQVGFSAPYAMAVHEKVAMKLKGERRLSGQGWYWDPRPRASAKFLEVAARRINQELRRIVREEAKVK